MEQLAEPGWLKLLMGQGVQAEAPLAEKVFAGQKAENAEPRRQKAPGGHCWQAVAPGALEKVPLGQGVGAAERGGQKLPAGHSTRAPELQK